MIQQKVRKKKIPGLMLIFIVQSVKNHETKQDVWLRRLAMLKCESRTSLHVVQYN